MTPDFCPNCGAEIPDKATACPECGSCEETGWSDAAKADSLGLPEESFDYDDFVQREFGDKKQANRRPRSLLWWLTAIIVLGVILSWAFFGR